MWETITIILISWFVGFIFGAVRERLLNKNYSKQDMINASKYGYNFHKTTRFPKQDFEDSCINNTKQWLMYYKRDE